MISKLARSLALLPILAPSTPALVPARTAAQEAEQGDDLQLIELRVTSAQPHVTVIDRGSADGLAKQDRVVLRPRDGRRVEGTIVRIGERAAVVELDDPNFVPEPGTRGEARVPRSRFAAQAPPVVPPVTVDQEGAQQQPPEHPPWERTDEEWNQQQPLLARVRPLRPSQRDPRITGRAYLFGDYIHNTEGNTRDILVRGGLDVLYENVFKEGGDLHFAGEYNFRETVVPDDDDDKDNMFRLDRLSYTWGGNRFAPNRFEVGRFLQHEMPEFGVLDGVEWNRRTEDGDSLGASIGWLPEPTPEQKSGRDLSLAGWYRWVLDESELLSITSGYQKTFHNYDSDRDLIVTRVLYLPPNEWTFTGTAWVDLYGSGDATKGSGAELTDAIVTTGRHYESGSDLRLTYTHQAFPEVDRYEFTPPTAQELADAKNDRLALYGRQALGGYFALLGQIAGWKDEIDEGGDGEVGFEVLDVLFDGSRFAASGFGTQGRFVRTAGWRASLGLVGAHSNWSVGYEFTLNNIDGFQTDNDDIPQHRARALWEHYSDSGWSVSLQADVLLYDSETAVHTGFLLQRSF